MSSRGKTFYQEVRNMCNMDFNFIWQLLCQMCGFGC